MLIFLSVLVVWPVGGWLAWRRRTETLPVDRGAWLARMVAGVTSFLTLLFVVFWVPIMLVDIQGGTVVVQYGLPPVLVGTLVIPLVTAALTVVVIVFAIMAWRRHYWSLGARIHYTLVAMAAAASTWEFAYLNMIGFHY